MIQSNMVMLWVCDHGCTAGTGSGYLMIYLDLEDIYDLLFSRNQMFVFFLTFPSFT